jgi:hypothetical protein
VSALLQTITTPQHRPGLLFALDILSLAGFPERNFIYWITNMSYTARRHRLSAWKTWLEFCDYKHISVSDLNKTTHPSFLMTDFLLYMSEINLPPSNRLRAKFAAIFLLEQLLCVRDLGHDRFVMDFSASTIISNPSKAKYKAIWDLSILLDFIRSSPPLSDLSNNQLVARVVALFMIFAMARPIEVFRANYSKQFFSKDGQQLSIPTKRKTDKGNNTSLLSLFRLSDKNLCPIRYWEEILRRARRTLGSSFVFPSSIFFWDSNRPMTSSAHLCVVTKTLLKQASIPKEFTTYSIRHATITKLFSIVPDKAQINAFTGHSNLANTAPKFYLHQSGNWLGHQLESPPKSTQPLVARASKFDGAPLQLQTHSDGNNNFSCDESSTGEESSTTPPPATTPRVVAGSRPSSVPAPNQTSVKRPLRIIKQTALSASSSIYSFF